MSGLLSLHRLAGRRGDGLLPAFTALFEERADILRNRPLTELPAMGNQSGPHPSGRLPAALPANVIALTPRKG